MTRRFRAWVVVKEATAAAAATKALEDEAANETKESGTEEIVLHTCLFFPLTNSIFFLVY